MSSEYPVLLVTSDATTSQTAVTALESNGHFVTGNVCRDLPELVAQLEQRPALGVLVDIDPQPAQLLADLDPIITRFSHARFIVLSSDYRQDLVLEAMQIGVRHFLLKQSIEAELAGALDRLIPKPGEDARRASSIVTIFGASGGCGATTLAINLANELHLETAEKVLLIDLDYAYGAIGACLGLKGRYGIADVLADRTRIDAQLISSTAVSYSEGVHALISPVSASGANSAPLSADNLRPALDACWRAYRYVVVDAPRVSADVALQLAIASDLTLPIRARDQP
jgi:pilus assembly protein CpaE